MTKIECPQCGTVGLLQTRGNSQRIQHYIGFQDGKRVYSYHRLDVIGSKPVEVNDLNLGSNPDKVADGEGFEPSTPNLGGWCSLRGCRWLQHPIRAELLAHNMPQPNQF